MISKLARYVLTGGMAAVIDVGCFRGFLAFGVPTILAASMSWLIAAFVNYGSTSRFVFQRAVSHKHALLFLAGAAVGLSINVSITVLFIRHFGIAPVWSKTLGIGVAFIFNFFINALWVFR